MEDLNSNEFRDSYESRVNPSRENVFIKIENTHAVESTLNQVQVLYSALDLQKSKRAADDNYRMNLFRSDFVSDGGLKDKFSKYYDSTTFNKSKTFRKSLSYTKLNSYTQSDNLLRNSGTFNKTCSEFRKFKPSSTKNSVVPFNRDSKPSGKEKEVKIFIPETQRLTEPDVKRLHIKYNSNKIVCSLKLNNDKENSSKRYSSCNNEAEKNNLDTDKKKKSISKSLNADNKSSLIINNYFINSLNNPNLADSIKEEKRLLTIEEKIDMMTKLVKAKEDIIIKQVRSELIQREKEKNSKIQKKINYLNDRNMLENINDEIKVENHTTPNECQQDRLLSLRSANLEDKMKFRVKSASLLNFKIDKKHIFKPRVDSIEYLKKIFNEKKRMKGRDFSKTFRKYENNYLSNSFLKSASREKYKSITVDSRGFRESNYNSTYKSTRNIKNEISDFIRRKNREHKENAIKLKDKENENLIKKYIELMKINNILERNNKNSSSSSRFVKKTQNKEVKKKEKIKNEMYIGNKHGKRKCPDDSSFLDYNQYYINILESRLILDPLFTIQKLAGGVNNSKKEVKAAKNKYLMNNIKTHRPKSSDKIQLIEEENKNSSQNRPNKNNRAQTNKEFLEFLNKKESEIKTKSISARNRLKKTNEKNKIMAINVVDSYSVKAIANTNQDEILPSEEGKTHNPKDDSIFDPDENSASLVKEESKLERSENIDNYKPRITAENIENLMSSIVLSIRHNVFALFKQFTASSYLTEHYIYSFNYFEALSDVFMARNVSFALNKINQYAYIKNIYEALNTFSIPAKRNALAKIYSYSEQMKVFNQEEIEVYQSYLNLISLFAKRDAFAKIKEYATKIELEEYEDDEEQLIEIYKYMLDKLSTMINKRYFNHFIGCLTNIKNKPKKINNSGTIELDQENFNSNSAYWFNKSIDNSEGKPSIESKCSKFSQELDPKEKSLNSCRDKMKNFVVNKFDQNKSDSSIKNVSASRIKNHTYVHESLSEKSCVLECNSYESPKLHRIYMLIEEQKRANQNSRKNGKENSDFLDSYKNNQSDSQENLSRYILDLQDGNMETSNRNISMIEEVLSEERESLEKPSQKNVNLDNNLSHSLSLLDSINNNLDSENKLEEKDMTKSYIKSEKQINKSYEEISEVINNIVSNSNKLKISCDAISEVNNDIQAKSFQNIVNTEENKSLEVNGGFGVDQSQNQSESKSSRNDREKSMKNTLTKDKENSIINSSQNSDKFSMGLNLELQKNLEKSNENKLNYSNVDSINLRILSKKNLNENSLSAKRDKTSRKNSDVFGNEEIVEEYLEINKSIASIRDNSGKSKLVDDESSEIIDENIDEDPNILEIHKSYVEEPAIKIVENKSPIESPKIPKIKENIYDVDQSLALHLSDKEISVIEESLEESKFENNFQPDDELKSICSIPELNELADQLTAEILKDLLNSEINEPKLIPKKSFSLLIDNQQNLKSSASIFSFNSNSFNNSNTTESTPTSMFNKTIFEQKKEDTQYLYEQKILPQMMRILKQEINNNYTNIVSNLTRPYTYNANDLLQNLIKEQTTNIKNNFLKLPFEIEDRELLPKNNIICQLEQTTKSIRKDCVNDKDCSDYENIINECVIEAAEEILKKERLYGEQGAPVQWSSRTRATAFKYTSSEISKNNLIKFFEEDFKNVSNTKMGLIQENNEELDFEQLNAEKEKRIIQSLTTDLYETEEIWKNFELEETQIKLELTELVLEQILNEVIEIFEHVHMSRRQPNLYQHKSIYACDDIPRLSFHQINTENEYDVMNI